MHALVQGGTITRFHDDADLLSTIAGGDGRVLPVIDEPPEYDPATQLLLGPIITVGESAVTASYTVEPLSAERMYAAALDRCRADRASEYVRKGCSMEELVEALVEAIAENRPDKLTELHARRSEVKAMFPKPSM